MANKPSDCYLGNALVKRDGIEHNFSKEEVKEYMKCSKDPIYFAEHYVKVINLDHGLVPFEPYSYQRKMLRHLKKNRFSIVLACRQSGKSITSVTYLLWIALFQPEQTIAILANKAAISKDMLSRITLALENIPFFLQPGCKGLNKFSIEFSNNSKIFASSTSSSSIRGTACNIIFLDEFAFVKNATEFYTSTYPVISSGKRTQVIITSTANGVGNIFYKIWQGAVQKANEFKPFRVDWWDVPGRGKRWKEQTIRNTSQLQFDQEYGNSFYGQVHTLINAEALMGMIARDPLKVMYENTLRIFQRPERDHLYICTVDVSQGRGQDFSTFVIIDVTSRPFQQVVVYSSNAISPLLFPDIIVKLATQYNQALVIVESNGPGQVVCNGIYYDYEYENMYAESTLKVGKIGLIQTKKTKRIGASTLKDLLEEDKLSIIDAASIMELSYFEEDGKSYKAKSGKHDDIVMALIIFAWFLSSAKYADYDEQNIKALLFENRLQEMEDELMNFAFITSEDQGYAKAEYEELRQNLEDWSENTEEWLRI